MDVVEISIQVVFEQLLRVLHKKEFAIGSDSLLSVVRGKVQLTLHLESDGLSRFRSERDQQTQQQEKLHWQGKLHCDT